MSKLIYFRDLGCQGAKDIVEKSIAFVQNDSTLSLESDKEILFLTKKDESQPLETQYSPISLWKATAEALSIPFLLAYDTKTIKAESIVVVDECFQKEYEAELSEIETKNFIVMQAPGMDFFSAKALSAFSTIVYSALNTGKKPEELVFACMGDAGGEYISYSDFLINSAICLKHELSFAFSEASAKDADKAINQNLLDLAMQAGAKLFLTYDPAFLESDIDLLYLLPWTYASSSFVPASHPYAFDKVQELFAEKTQVVSFLDEVESTPINVELYTKTAVATRVATLLYYIENY